MPTPFKMTNWLEAQILGLVLLNDTSFTAPPLVYMGLFTSFTELDDGNTFSELGTGIGYARQIVAFDPPVNGVTHNSDIIDFPIATVDWPSFTYWGIFDASTDGNLLIWGSTPVAETVLSGMQFEIATGDISIAMSGALPADLANALISHILCGITYASPTGVWCGILTAYYSDSMFTELSNVNYLRQATTFATPDDTVTDTTNTADIIFPVMTATYTATHAAIFDASTGGNMIFRNPLISPVVVPIGKSLKFAAGNMTVSTD